MTTLSRRRFELVKTFTVYFDNCQNEPYSSVMLNGCLQSSHFLMLRYNNHFTKQASWTYDSVPLHAQGFLSSIDLA